MPGESRRIDLNSLFESAQQNMVAELTGVRRVVDHGVTLGDETEVSWVRFLNSILPNRYQACDGFVVNADGRRSDQIDLIVFDRQYSPPLFRLGNVQYVPAEAVYAVFEVKQSIDARRLKAASEKAASVRRLRRTTAPIPTADGLVDAKTPHRIVSGILALSFADRGAPEDMVARQMGRASEEGRLDLGCAIRDGSFVVTYEESGVPSVSLSPGSSSLITFFFRFQSMLQALGTVPAIDYSEYIRAAMDSSHCDT